MRRDLPCGLAFLWLGILGAAALFADVADPSALDLQARFAGPSAAHWLGRDELGRDLLARLAHGARYVFLVTGCASVLAVLLGALLGVTAAWARGWFDRAVALAIDFLWAVPVVVAVTLLVSALGVSAGSLILVIGAVNWVGSARIFRAETARLRGSDCLRTARAFGLEPWRLVVVHVVPQLRPVLITVLSLCAIETLTLETGLVFLGVRLPPPTPTWGGILVDGTAYIANASWLVAAPSLVIVLTLASLRIVATRAAAPTWP